MLSGSVTKILFLTNQVVFNDQMFSKPYNSREDQIFRGGLLLVMIKLRSDSGTEEIIMHPPVISAVVLLVAICNFK